MKLVKVQYKTLGGTTRIRTFIKIEAGYIPITILEHLEDIKDIISEKPLTIIEQTGEIS
jgi:hypothetical protein